jgi:hypothetical protein
LLSVSCLYERRRRRNPSPSGQNGRKSSRKEFYAIPRVRGLDPEFGRQKLQVVNI